jgi:hypothetical protein
LSSTDWEVRDNQTGSLDDPDEWTLLDELAAFFEASSPEEFHRMLMVSPILPE